MGDPGAGGGVAESQSALLAILEVGIDTSAGSVIDLHIHPRLEPNFLPLRHPPRTYRIVPRIYFIQLDLTARTKAR